VGIVWAAGVATGDAAVCAVVFWDEMPMHNASRQRALKDFMRQPPQNVGNPAR
jgi:hypothetical protein